jgi:hypothetical protein
MSALCHKQTSAASLDHLISKGLIDEFVSATSVGKLLPVPRPAQ